MTAVPVIRALSFAYSVELLSSRATNFSVPTRLPNSSRPRTAPVAPSPAVWNPEPGKKPASTRMLFFHEGASDVLVRHVIDALDRERPSSTAPSDGHPAKHNTRARPDLFGEGEVGRFVAPNSRLPPPKIPDSRTPSPPRPVFFPKRALYPGGVALRSQADTERATGAH